MFLFSLFLFVGFNELNNVFGCNFVVQCARVFLMEKERLGASCCRLRGVVQFASFSRCDCSGCLICLGLF